MKLLLHFHICGSIKKVSEMAYSSEWLTGTCD